MITQSFPKLFPSLQLQAWRMIFSAFYPAPTLHERAHSSLDSHTLPCLHDFFIKGAMAIWTHLAGNALSHIRNDAQYGKALSALSFKLSSRGLTVLHQVMSGHSLLSYWWSFPQVRSISVPSSPSPRFLPASPCPWKDRMKTAREENSFFSLVFRETEAYILTCFVNKWTYIKDRSCA